MPTDRRLRRFVRQWRKRYPLPVPWVDERANRQCRRSEAEWLEQFKDVPVLKRRQVISLALWKFAGNGVLMEEAVKAVEAPGDWGHARRSIKKALAATNVTEALDCLIAEAGGVNGWGPEMASTILSACRPGSYAVIDVRALRSLRALGLHEPAQPDTVVRSDWWPFLRWCRELSELSGLSLTSVRQALWAAADDAPDLPGTR